MALRLAFVAALLLSAVAATDLKFDGDDSKTVLLSFGEATADCNVLCKDASGVSVSGNDLFSVGTISSAAAAGGYTNYTIPMTFAAGVGVDSYTVECGSDSVTGQVVVAGLVIKDGSAVASGENGAGVSVGQTGSVSYDVVATGTDGSAADLSGCAISARASSGTYMEEVNVEKTTITDSKFTLTLNDYQVGTGSFVIDIDCATLSYRGENFETILKVSQETSPAPACLVMGGEMDTKGGKVTVTMKNLLSPPQDSPIETVTMTVGGETIEWSKDESDLSLPTQKVVFQTSAGGKASIKCDGADAKVIGDDLMVSGDDSAPALVGEVVADAPEAGDGQSVLEVTVRVVNADPTTMTKVQGESLRDIICRACLSSNCAIVEVWKGSVMAKVVAVVDDAEKSQDSLKDAFDEETCPASKEYADKCGEVTLEETKALAVAGAATTATAAAGLATWTIVLIAGLGAFALIALIMLGLLAVYRRSAEVSESDYSSSGPLGVPDPSDLLYEQSIVRDIYGRGDFPEGGPTPAVAEQRAREADLREEMPRPPSSSGLSRQSAATDDASSTYSV